MVFIKNCIAVKYFVIILFLTSTMHANPLDDNKECIRQINLAFGNNDTAEGCFMYAIEHYIKGQNIPIPKKENFDVSQSLNIAGSSQHDSNPRVKVNSFEELMSERQAADNPTGDGSHKELTSRKKPGPTIYVDNFEDLMSNNQPDPHVQVNSTNELMSSENTDEHIDVTNYAMLYYQELERMIQGNSVVNRIQFCREYYQNDFYNCHDSLRLFGNSGKCAVGTALTVYSFTKYDNNDYIYKYMRYIKETVMIISPSTKPQTFCTRLMKAKLIAEITIT